MELKYKPDFERAKKYFEAFWQKEVIDRPLVSITAPGKNGSWPDYHEINCVNTFRARGDRDDTLRLLEGYERYAAGITWMGEAIPYVQMDFGPDMFASFFGAEIQASDSVATTWSVPSVTDWTAFDGKMDTSEGSYYDYFFKTLRWAAEFSEGKFLISCPDIHANLDALSALRGPQNLCFDLMDCPGEVEEALRRVRAEFKPLWDNIFNTLRAHERGSLGWIPTYSSGRFATLQCDAICLIGPPQARRFVIPALVEECGYMDSVSYHFDGKEALPHLEDILAIDGIDVIQWVPGDGQPRSIEWMDLLHRIQAAGKGLWIYDWTAEEIKSRFKELKPEGLIFSVGVNSIDEGEELLEHLVKNM